MTQAGCAQGVAAACCHHRRPICFRTSGINLTRRTFGINLKIFPMADVVLRFLTASGEICLRNLTMSHCQQTQQAGGDIVLINLNRRTSFVQLEDPPK